MTLAGLAFNNIRRTPMRALLTAGSVMMAAATLSVVLSVDRGYRGGAAGSGRADRRAPLHHQGGLSHRGGP
jgi:hypothetical protein